MNRRFVLLVLSALQLSILTVLGQGSVTGRVVDKSGKPIDAAAVYINGTTLRTSTSNTGAFELKDVTFPCTLVVSHLGHQTVKASLEGPPAMPLLLYMMDKDINLSEVMVEGKDKSEELLKSFRENFLGYDTWGKAASILNEKALVYKLSYNEDTAKVSYTGSLAQRSLPGALVERTLVVQAKEPLQVDLPLLGYTAFVDLDNFSLMRTRSFYDPSTSLTIEQSEICRYMGSYSIKPYESVSKSKQRRFERNREEAYYNSRMHFGQALYRKELLKNGFLFLTCRLDSVNKKYYYDWVNLDSCTRYDNKGNMLIYGLSGQQFEIHYFAHANGSPIDLSKKKYDDPLDYLEKYNIYFKESNSSGIYFIYDTCILRKNGIVPEVSISFSGRISQKKAGATLPDDYTPPVK